MGEAVFPPYYLPGPNYGGGNEDNGDLPQKTPCMHCYSPCPQSCSRPPPTHTFTRDSWTPTGKSGTVSCGITAPFSWVLVHKVLLCPPRDYFPVLYKFWQFYGGVNGDLLQDGLCHTTSAAPRAPAPWQFTADPYLHRRCSDTVLSQSLWGLRDLKHCNPLKELLLVVWATMKHKYWGKKDVLTTVTVFRERKWYKRNICGFGLSSTHFCSTQW